MSIGKRVSEGFFQFLGRNFIGRFMGIWAIAVLARELDPYDFGVMSITEVLLRVIAGFTTAGISEYLLAYREKDETEIFRSAFWFNGALIVVVVGVMLLLLPFWAEHNEDARIINLGFMVAGVFIFSQLVQIPKAWLARQLAFKKQVRLETPFIILIPIGKIVAAYAGLGIYSLVVPTLFFSAIQCVVFYLQVDWRPSWRLYLNRWKEIFNFTRYLIGSAIIARLTDDGDKFIVSELIGREALGLYNTAYVLSNLIPANVVGVTNKILSSALPKYVDDNHVFYRHYMRFLKTLSFFVIPVMIGMILSARPLIELIYTDKFAGAVLPFQILMVYAIVRCLTSSYGSVVNTLHLPQKGFFLSLVYTPFHLIGSFIGASFSIVGLAISVVAVKFVFVNIGVKQIMDALQKPFLRFYADLSIYFAIGLWCVLPVWFAYIALAPYLSLGLWGPLLVQSIVYAVVYLATFKLFGKGELDLIGDFFARSDKRLALLWNKIINW